MKQGAPEAFAACIGIDWADRKHDVCLQAAGAEHESASASRIRPRLSTRGSAPCAPGAMVHRLPSASNSTKGLLSPPCARMTS